MSEEKPKSKKKLIIIIGAVVLLLVLVGGGVAAWMLMGSHSDAETAQDDGAKKAKKKEKKEESAPIFEKLEVFTVNLSSQGSSMLQVEMHVQLANEHLREQVKNYMPKIRSSVILLLSSKKPEELKTNEGKIKLIQELKTNINKVLGIEDPAEGVIDVTFSSFILQE